MALLLASAAASAAELTGRVVGVTDGDIITVLDASKKQHKIRLSGIDAPALKQAFGTQSKKNLSDLVYNRQVTIESNKQDRNKRERRNADYGRSLHPCRLGNGVLAKQQSDDVAILRAF